MKNRVIDWIGKTEIGKRALQEEHFRAVLFA